MDQSAFIVRRRAERVATAIVNSRRALRAAITASSGGSVPMVPVPAPELQSLIRAAAPPGADRPTRKAHAELVAAMELAHVRLILQSHKGAAPRETAVAVGLVHRLAGRWLKHQAEQEANDLDRAHRVSRRKLLPQKIKRSQFVPTTPDPRDWQMQPANDAARVAKKHWRRRTRPEQAMIDLAREKWDHPRPDETSASTHARDLRRARLASYTPDELAEAAEIAGAFNPPPQEPADMARRTTTTTSTATPPASSTNTAAAATLAAESRDAHGRFNQPGKPSRADLHAAQAAGTRAGHQAPGTGSPTKSRKRA